jgi:uncharacterized YigZ family protein
LSEFTSYETIAGEAVSEIMIEKSTFIAHAVGVVSREGATQEIAKIKAQYPGATHHVPAFIVGEKQELMWASDDNEPSGTAGQPILKVIESEGLTNVLIVVVRYFGGVKLGTGGLARAYTSATKAVIEAAGRVRVVPGIRMEVEIAYTYYDKVVRELKLLGVETGQGEFGETICLPITASLEQQEKVTQLLVSLTNGQIKLLNSSLTNIHQRFPPSRE